MKLDFWEIQQAPPPPPHFLKNVCENRLKTWNMRLSFKAGWHVPVSFSWIYETATCIELGGLHLTKFRSGRAIKASKNIPFLIPIFQKCCKPDMFIPIFRKTVSDLILPTKVLKISTVPYAKIVKIDTVPYFENWCCVRSRVPVPKLYVVHPPGYWV